MSMSQIAIRKCQEVFGNQTVNVREVYAYLDKIGMKINPSLFANYRVSRGFYNFSKSSVSIPTPTVFEPQVAQPEECEDTILTRIKSRFRTLDKLTKASCSGIIRAMIVSGPGGLGKTFGVMREVGRVPEERVRHVKGHISAGGLYRLFYANRFKGNVLVFDDADSIFEDEQRLNYLKAACDTSDRRVLSWYSSKELLDADGEVLPESFEFEGTVIFITNKDFRAELAKGSRMAPHFEAMMSRSHYLDLGIKTKTDYIVRIKQVVSEEGMLDNLNPTLRNDIVDFISTNRDRMNELSLRMALKLADLAKIDEKSWKEMAEASCMR